MLISEADKLINKWPSFSICAKSIPKGVYTLKIIPVIDILAGIAVHAVKGKRREYKSLESILFKSVEPVEIAKAFKTLGFNELYIADLDSIVDCSIKFEAFLNPSSIKQTLN